MKAKFLLLILGMFCCTDIAAIVLEIPMQNISGNEEDWAKDYRSITLKPTATIEGNTICIYTDVAVSELHASIKDSMGNIVYTYNDTASSRCHTFEVYDLPEGDYILELIIGEEYYYGIFSYRQDI